MSPSASELRRQPQVGIGYRCPCVAAAKDQNNVAQPSPLAPQSLIDRRRCSGPAALGAVLGPGSVGRSGPCILSLSVDNLPQSRRAPEQQNSGTVQQRERQNTGVLKR